MKREARRWNYDRKYSRDMIRVIERYHEEVKVEYTGLGIGRKLELRNSESTRL